MACHRLRLINDYLIVHNALGYNFSPLLGSKRLKLIWLYLAGAAVVALSTENKDITSRPLSKTRADPLFFFPFLLIVHREIHDGENTQTAVSHDNP